MPRNKKVRAIHREEALRGVGAVAQWLESEYGCQFESWLFHLEYSSLLMHLERQQKLAQVLGPRYSLGRTGWNSRLTTWPNPCLRGVDQ